MATENTGRNANYLRIILKIISTILGPLCGVYAAFNFSNEFKLIVLGLVILFWILFEFIKSFKGAILDLVWTFVNDKQEKSSSARKEAQLPAIRWGMVGLLLLFIVGWAYGKYTEPPPPPGMVYYMIVLDASETMKEPFDGYPSKWIAVRTAFQQFYERSHPISNYGLVLIGGQNPQETSGDSCSLPTVPLIPVVSENWKVLPHRKLTLPILQEQVEGQQPQGGGSLSRAFYLAKNQLESLPLETSKVMVVIANASDICAGRIDWDTLASEIEMVNKTIAIRKELILIDVEATQEAVAFAEQINAKDDPNMIVQVVQTYYQLEMSILYVLERNEVDVMALEAEATAKAQSKTDEVLIPVTGTTPIVLASQLPKPHKVIVAASATSTPTLTFTPTLTPTFTLTFTPTSTFTATATFTNTPTLTCTLSAPSIIIYPTATKDGSKPPPPPTNTPTKTPDRCGALCNDGTTTTATGSGACSGHDGVKEWLYPPNCP